MQLTGSILLYSQSKGGVAHIVDYLGEFQVSLMVVNMLDDALAVLQMSRCNACIIHVDTETAWGWQQIAEIVNASVATQFVLVGDTTGDLPKELEGTNTVALAMGDCLAVAGNAGNAGNAASTATHLEQALPMVLVRRKRVGILLDGSTNTHADHATNTHADHADHATNTHADHATNTHADHADHVASSSGTSGSPLRLPPYFAKHTRWVAEPSSGEVSKANYHTGSFRMKSLLRHIVKVSETQSHALIEGEEGVGKIALALWLHSLSSSSGVFGDGCVCLCIDLGAMIGSGGGVASVNISGTKVLDDIFGTVEQGYGSVSFAGVGTLVLQGVNLLSSRLQKRVAGFIHHQQQLADVDADVDTDADAYADVDADADVDVDVDGEGNGEGNGEGGLRVVLVSSSPTVPNVSHSDGVSTKRVGNFHNSIYEIEGLEVVNVPPLRERREDIPHFINLLVTQYSREFYAAEKHYAEKHASSTIPRGGRGEDHAGKRSGVAEHAKVIRSILLGGGQLKGALAEHHYRGNIDELARIVRYVVFRYPHINIQQFALEIRSKGAGGSVLNMDNALYLLGLRLASSSDIVAGSFTFDEYTKVVEPPLFRAVLDYTNGNKTKTASILGISRTTLRKKLNDYDLLDDTNP